MLSRVMVLSLMLLAATVDFAAAQPAKLTPAGSVQVRTRPPGADGRDGYVPPTYELHMNYMLPAGHTWRFPVMAAYDENPGITWQEDLHNLPNTDFRGVYIMDVSPDFLDTFGFALYDGPAYPTPIDPGAVWLIEYTVPACLPDYVNPLTPEPPTWEEAKAAADAECVATCGDGFEMTDFDMNQWRYACYKYQAKAYQTITWGGSTCEKMEDNGLIQPCNPTADLTAIRNHLNEPASACPECDLDGDGLITLRDLVLARNTAFGPREVGQGLTFPIVYDAGVTIEQTMPLTQYATPDKQTRATCMEITHWDETTPVDCYDPGSHMAHLEEVTTSNPGSQTLFGQDLANQYCSGICAQDAIGYAIGHCRISKEGIHSIRVTAGYCHYCE